MSSYGFADGQQITSWLGVPIDEASGYALGAGVLTVGPVVLTNFASVIVALKPTGGQVTLKVTQGVSAGPPSLQLVEQIVVPAGSTLFEAFVLFGDSVTIEVDGAVGGTLLDYAIYPSNTTTNAQVITQATIDVQHNGVLVGAEPTLDLEDSPTLLWTVTDDGANTRAKITARAQQEIAAAVVTADVAVTSAGLVTVISSGAVNVPFTGEYLLEWFCAGYTTNETSEQCTCYLEIDGNGCMIALPLTNTARPFAPFVLRRRDAIAAGNHTFDVKAITSVGTCTFKASIGGGGFAPMLLTLAAV